MDILPTDPVKMLMFTLHHRKPNDERLKTDYKKIMGVLGEYTRNDLHH